MSTLLPARLDQSVLHESIQVVSNGADRHAQRVRQDRRRHSPKDRLVLVFPDLDLVIATFGGSYGSRGWRYLGGELIRDYVLPAVGD